MNRKTAVTTALIAVGLIVPRYSGGLNPTQPRVPPAISNSQSGEPLAKNDTDAGPDFGPWTPVCNYFQPLPTPTASKKGAKDVTNFCLDSTHSPPTQLTVIIATVPDPELTHLSMVFDRYIESITAAAADGDLDKQQYRFNSYWFPWHPGAQEETDPVKQERAEKERDKRVSTPGILLFRQLDDPDHLLLVFLVGETPTSGVNRTAFLQAWKYGKELDTSRKDKKELDTPPPLPICADSQCVAILGPSFTGSMPSLKRLLADPSVVDPALPTVVISGAVTGIPPAEGLALLAPAHFCTTIETETNRLIALTTYLGTALSGHFALLREDETQYGEGMGNSQPVPGLPLVLRYPRGLARVRNLAGQLPGLSTLASHSSRYPELPMDLRDTGQDSIPSFGQQTPVSQEAVLFELAATMRREDIRYAGIVATDPLDALFLIRSIRAMVPNLRIVIFHADELFARAAASWGLRGIIAITSYPLVSRNQHYSPTRQPRRTEFADESAEGEYNAFRRMFLRSPSPPTKVSTDNNSWCSQIPNASSEVDGDYLLDYTGPFAGALEDGVALAPKDPRRHKPSIWVDVLGRNAWWPAATIDATSPSLLPSPLLSGPDLTGHRRGVRDWS
jgi:hypothetical protein